MMRHIALVILALATIIFGAAFADSVTCGVKADAMSVKYKWNMFSGCMIQLEGKHTWIPINQYRVVD